MSNNKKTAFLFPGQGAQTVGMGKDLYDNSESARKILDKADDVLGTDLTRTIFEGPKEELTSTENTQPALLAVSYAFHNELREKGIAPDVCVGHSLGELTGLVCAGYISYEDGLKLVRKRGELMKNSDPEGKGGMAAIIGAAEDQIKEAISELGNDDYVICANYNSPSQIVISGLKDSIKKINPILKEKGAKKIIPLTVSGPFHTKLMQNASSELESYVKDITINVNSDCKVISNYTADFYTNENAKENIVKQITNPVRFVDCIEKLQNEEPHNNFEVGPGRVVTGLIKKIDRRMQVININSLESLGNI